MTSKIYKLKFHPGFLLPRHKSHVRCCLCPGGALPGLPRVPAHAAAFLTPLWAAWRRQGLRATTGRRLRSASSRGRAAAGTRNAQTRRNRGTRRTPAAELWLSIPLVAVWEVTPNTANGDIAAHPARAHMHVRGVCRLCGASAHVRGVCHTPVPRGARGARGACPLHPALRRRERIPSVRTVGGHLREPAPWTEGSSRHAPRSGDQYRRCFCIRLPQSSKSNQSI